jgi:hypothetical protein
MLVAWFLDGGCWRGGGRAILRLRAGYLCRFSRAVLEVIGDAAESKDGESVVVAAFDLVGGRRWLPRARGFPLKLLVRWQARLLAAKSIRPTSFSAGP